MTTKAKARRNGARETTSRLYEQLLHWLYEKGNSSKARVCAQRLRNSLRDSEKRGAIFIEECLSLIAEAEGDFRSAIRHRAKEIELIKQAHTNSMATPHEQYVFGQYDFEDLRDRLVLLAWLYHDAGNLDAAIGTLKNCREYCENLHIEFENDDDLKGYLAERGETSPLNVTASSNAYGHSEGHFSAIVLMRYLVAHATIARPIRQLIGHTADERFASPAHDEFASGSLGLLGSEVLSCERYATASV